MILTPILSGAAPYNFGVAETYSYVPIANDQGRTLFAKATYITNPSDITSGGFNIPAFNNISITNDLSGNPTQYNYSLNGTAVATLSCTYNGSGYLINIRQTL